LLENHRHPRGNQNTSNRPTGIYSGGSVTVIRTIDEAYRAVVYGGWMKLVGYSWYGARVLSAALSLPRQVARQ